MQKRIALLHYASPPIVGGVEATIAHHARGLTNSGYAVRVVSGSGAPFDTRIECVIDPLFGSKHPDVLAVKRELDAGTVSPAFEALVARQAAALEQALDGCDTCIAHNLHTLNKNLPLTAALAGLSIANPIAWCHDLAWTNPQYRPELHDGYPWRLLREPWPGTRYVTISEARRAELSALFGARPESIPVITPGIDPAQFLGWTESTKRLEARFHLLDADGLLLLPARLTRRKNVALALRVLAELRRISRQDFRLIVTGPPGPHNPANRDYLSELIELRAGLGLQDAAHFLYELDDPPFIPDDATIANLYLLADALFFPSVQEGFGIPLLEAGLAGIPVFCANIPPLRAIGQGDVTLFDPSRGSAESIAALVLDRLRSSRLYRLRVRVRREYRWESLIRKQVLPLLENR